MLSLALQLHTRLQFTIVLFMLAMGIWGIINYAQKKPVTPDYIGALVIGEILILVEAILGFYLYLSDFRPSRSEIHILYGVTAFIALPGAFAFTRGKDSRWEGLIYAGVCLFLAGLAIRLQLIATPPV